MAQRASRTDVGQMPTYIGMLYIYAYTYIYVKGPGEHNGATCIAY